MDPFGLGCGGLQSVEWVGETVDLRDHEEFEEVTILRSQALSLAI